MTREEIQNEITEIEQVYADFESKISRLKNEQDSLAKQFLKELEENKLHELRTLLS